MDPNAFQTLAVELLSRGTPEARRAAIGRSYYATFNVAASALRSHFPIGQGASAHGEVPRHLANCGDLELQRAASQLDGMKWLRNRADYDMDDRTSEGASNAKVYVALADRTIAAIQAAFAGPKRTAIVAAISEYRRKIGLPNPR